MIETLALQRVQAPSAAGSSWGDVPLHRRQPLRRAAAWLRDSLAEVREGMRGLPRES